MNNLFKLLCVYEIEFRGFSWVWVTWWLVEQPITDHVFCQSVVFCTVVGCVGWPLWNRAMLSSHKIMPSSNRAIMTTTRTIIMLQVCFQDLCEKQCITPFTAYVTISSLAEIRLYFQINVETCFVDAWKWFIRLFCWASTKYLIRIWITVVRHALDSLPDFFFFFLMQCSNGHDFLVRELEVLAQLTSVRRQLNVVFLACFGRNANLEIILSFT